MPDLPPPDEQLVADNAALRVENAALRAEVEELRASDAAVRAEHAEMKSMVAALNGQVAQLERVIREQADEIAGLKRQAAADSSNSSRPPSSDAPWAKKPAKKRSSRPGRDAGRASSRVRRRPRGASLTIRTSGWRSSRIVAGRVTRRCAGAEEHGRQRRQIVDIQPVPPPKVTEYQRISKVCPCCGTVTTPGWDDASGACRARRYRGRAGFAGADRPGNPGPRRVTDVRALPAGRAGPRPAGDVVCDRCLHRVPRRGPWPRRAHGWRRSSSPTCATLLAGAPVLHADETPGRAAGSLAYVHVACTEYLTLMHVGDRTSDESMPAVSCRSSPGCWSATATPATQHLQAVHAWCGAHLLRDLRALSDADPDGQLWAQRWPTP